MTGERRTDVVSLAAGLVLIALGAILALDQAGAFDLSFNLLGAAVAATIGTILLVSGLNDGDG